MPDQTKDEPRPMALHARETSMAALGLVVLAAGIIGVAVAGSTPGPGSEPGAHRGSGAPTTDGSAPSSAPEQQPAASTGLNALYAAIDLDVPLVAIPKDERPGCAPNPDPDQDVVGGHTPAPVEVPIVPDEELPDPVPHTPFEPDASIVAGHGMWLWQYTKTEGGDFDRMVERAVEAGLDHVWVRVGDSRDGFYAAEQLDQFVPRAHAAGLRVIGWGFPFLHDPLRDTAWVDQALAWRGPHGRGLDAYSPDIERETEGVILDRRRVEIHLASMRANHPDVPIIATVYPATDWILETDYPYDLIAEYVDGFATMDYWSCGDSGLRASHSIDRLAQYDRAVHVIGQAFIGGRWLPPSRAETLRFLDTAVRAGANGASWWVWQLIGDEQWEAISAYPWHAAVASNAQAPRPAIIPEG